MTVSIDLGSLGPTRLGESLTLADGDPTATNTLEHQERVAPTPNRSVRIEDSVLTVELPPISWTALQLILRAALARTLEVRHHEETIATYAAKVSTNLRYSP